MKQFLERWKILLLVFIMILAFTITSFGQVTDIHNHWAKEDINFFLKHGVVEGYDDNTFRPNKDISRAEFVKVINKAMGYEEVKAFSFKDVKSGHWFYEDIGKAVAAGYLTGYNDNTVRPNSPISRQEAATILCRVFEFDELQNLPSPFKDDSMIQNYARGFVYSLAEKGYVQGYTDNTFGPRGNITRAETARMIVNTLRGEGVTLPPNDERPDDKEPEIPSPDYKAPIHPDEIPWNIEILEPDSIGTVYMEATYTNNSNYPITGFSMRVLLKDKNKITYLSSYETVLPGQTSSKFDSFGPETLSNQDYEILELSVTTRTKKNNKLYIDYDFRLKEVELMEIEESPININEAPILPDEIPWNINILNPDSIGTVYMEAAYTNNSNYPITGFSMRVLLKDKNEITYLSSYETVLPGQTSTKFDSFGPQTLRDEDYEILELDITTRTKDNNKLYIDYDFRLNEVELMEAKN